MNTSNTVSIGNILWKILNNKLASDLTYDEAAEFATEAIRLIGAPVLYDDKFYTVDIVDYKAKLPNDILYITGVRDLDKDLPFREATDIYHRSDNNRQFTEYTYQIKKGIIFTSLQEGCIEVAYKGLLTDENGYPLIVDNEKAKLAIEYYILHRYLEPLWMMGKITDKAFQYIEQKRHFYMAAANTNLQMPSMDKMEAIMNGINKIVRSTDSHARHFKNYGDKEYIKRYN